MSCVPTCLTEQPDSEKHGNSSNSTHSFEYFKDFEFVINTHMIFFLRDILHFLEAYFGDSGGWSVTGICWESLSILQYVGRP